MPQENQQRKTQFIRSLIITVFYTRKYCSYNAKLLERIEHSGNW